MIPTGQNICDRVRSILGDTQVAGGQIFTNTFLYGANNQGPLQAGYTWLFERMRTQNDRRSRRTSFALVNPNINYLSPATLGIANMGNPIDIWERPLTASYTLTGITLVPASTGVDPYALVAIPHNGALVSGQTIETYLIQGIDDSINDYWTINVPDSGHIQLMGCTSVGTWTAGTGLVLVSTQPWPGQPMTPSWDLVQTPNASQGSPSNNSSANQMLYWDWQNAVIRVPPITSPEEIRLVYNLSGQIPSDPAASLGIDDCLNVISYFAAADAGRSKGRPADSTDSWRASADQFMKEFMQPVTKDLQRRRIVVPPFRPRRNTGYFNPF